MHRLLFLCVVCCLPFLATAEIYTEAPENFHPKAEAAGCFIEYKDKFLMLHRQDYKSQGSRWGVPGGKLDPGETPLEAAVRETCEETGIDISHEEIQFHGKFYVRNAAGDAIFYVFSCATDQDPSKVAISFKEHKGFTWVTPEDALKMNLILDEETIIELLYGEK